MILRGVGDSTAPPAEPAAEVAEELVEVLSNGSSPTAEGVDVETTHRLRRALRILLAARRRDDGGVQNGGS
jgi:hypothetical protein